MFEFFTGTLALGNVGLKEANAMPMMLQNPNHISIQQHHHHQMQQNLEQKKNSNDDIGNILVYTIF